jgi:hypothetical protein
VFIAAFVVCFVFCVKYPRVGKVPAPFNLSEGKGKDAIGRSAKQVR